MRTISFLGKMITGDGGLAPYRSGPQLVRFFNEFGFNDVYGQGFPSRWYYAEEKIRAINGKKEMVSVFENLLDPRNYIDTKFKPEEIAKELNKYLKYDGYELVKKGDLIRLSSLKGSSVESESISQFNKESIGEQLTKCQIKIKEGDCTGAITNARSLLESVLLEIRRDLASETKQYDGDLGKLLKEVLVLFGHDPAKNKKDNIISQITKGLSSVVAGLASGRNNMSDAHPVNYKPEPYEAKLVVNSAIALSDYFFELYKSRKT